MTKATEARDTATESGQVRLGTGIAPLDEILYGGFPANRIYLIQGEPGTGKTTLGMQYLMEGVKQGEAGLYVTMSETREELDTIAASHGWSLEGFSIYAWESTEDSLKPESQYTIFHPSEIELSETTSAVLAEVERVKPQRVVFDSLSEMRLLANDALRFRRQIRSLKQYFAGKQSTVLLLDDKVDHGQNLQVQTIAHGVISLEHLAIEYGAERRRLRVTKLRGSKFRGGYHDFNIETGGVVVFPRLVAMEHRQEFEKGPVASGIQALDSLLGGGLDRGTSTLIMGPAGSGKSTLAAHFAASATRRGEHAAIFVFDELKETFIRRADGTGIQLQKSIDNGLLTIQQVDPAELSPGEFAHAVRTSVERSEAKVVIIDSLNGYLNAMPEERFLTIQMHELLTYLNQLGVVTIMVMAQHGFLGSQMGTPVDVSYLADNVLLLRYFEAEGAVRRALSVVKKRTGAHESTIREMKITSDGIRFGAPLREFRGVLTGVPTYDGNRADREQGFE
ncbi:MAG TPA: ATPase domain-containing protein [Pyrinomonadaceae bacterium]|jgi:circadian clock protein KaiC|nr:ATPase domain-containing protein [Pyrinomonadaceae bacterium]